MNDDSFPRAPESRSDLRHGLRPEEARAWAEDGFFFRPACFTAEEVAALCEAAERVVALATGALRDAEGYAIDGNAYREARVGEWPCTVQLEHQPGSKTLRVIEPFHGLDPVFEALVDDPRIVEPMRSLVGDDEVALFTDKINLKRPREGSRFSWHQDSPYWAHFHEELDRLPNVLITLDDAHEGNGCFRVIRGSHTRGPLPGREGEGVLGPLFTHPDLFDENDAVLAELPAGSLAFFSPHTVHGSEPNRSAEARRAVVFTYQPGHARMFKLPRVRPAGAAA
ncbi:MAG: phytanoyl-CoA dioxygenase family protein [Myxococcota bacterium]|nr:phytanoyl-CoA dioxygenase family protein [Myxococcota bacterium]